MVFRVHHASSELRSIKILMLSDGVIGFTLHGMDIWPMDPLFV